ncbi:hypothetical protein Dda_3662 [Drechslerella dactyloides]|uniref:Uncharacterized protein n=1 Tax=Drechslerella dactyloides TaxID=74499 RepID=A0AAD6J2U5_DREDA|nr:hypothetical protein Dda_3662 [Drechslerella dactyloides]
MQQCIATSSDSVDENLFATPSQSHRGLNGQPPSNQLSFHSPSHFVISPAALHPPPAKGLHAGLLDAAVPQSHSPTATVTPTSWTTPPPAFCIRQTDKGQPDGTASLPLLNRATFRIDSPLASGLFRPGQLYHYNIDRHVTLPTMTDYYDEGDSFAYDDDGGPSSPMSPDHAAAAAANGMGLGSLADELAAAWSDDDGDELDDAPRSPTTPRSPTHRRHASISSVGSAGSAGRKRFARLSNETASSIVSNGTTATSATTASKPPPIRHHRRLSSSARLDVNGAGTGISPSLEDKIGQIESEALRGLSMVKSWSRRQRAGLSKRRGDVNGVVEEDAVGEEEDPICRLLDGLQGLSSQSGIETGSQRSRLVTAHGSLAIHVENQSRTLRDLSLQLNAPGTTITASAPRLSTHPITISSSSSSNHTITATLSPPDEDPEEDSEDDGIATLLSSLPTPAIEPLRDIQSLHMLTLQLISHFAALSDAIHMFRQQSNAVSRKLRGAKEAMRDWKAEVEVVETAHRYIDEGDWEARLGRREAAGVCREVLGGFEDVIRGMERRIEGLC